MKSKVVPVLFIFLILPWILTREFRIEAHHEAGLRHKSESGIMQEPVPGNVNEAAAQLTNYDELSTKQIYYLIP